MRVPAASRRSSDISARYGSLPILNGHKAQSSAPHRLTSAAEPQQQSRHFARMASPRLARGQPQLLQRIP
jgi:hypothetical protein